MARLIAYTTLKLRRELTHAVALHAHSGDTDDIRARAAIEVELLDIFIDQGDTMLRRGESGE